MLIIVTSTSTVFSQVWIQCCCFFVFFYSFPPELDQPPVAHVVSSPSIALPVRTATLDGSHSTDDKGGVSYLWTRDDSSPAAGVRG